MKKEISDILPLPMLMVRLGVNQDVTPKISVNKQWRSNQDQPNIIKFEIYTRHEQFCEEMVKDAKADPEAFLTSTKMFLEFTMVVGQHAKRSLNITGETFVKSKFLSNLDNKHTNKSGIIYLASSDLNKLARDIYRTASAQDNVTSTYVPSEQENQIITELLDVIRGQIVHSNDLTKDEWNSVFWDNIFSRPDVQTEYFSDVLKYDKGENHFKYDRTADKEFTENKFKKYHNERETTDSTSFGFSLEGFFGFDASDSQTDKSKSDGEKKDDVKKEKDKLSLGVTSTYGDSAKFDDENKYDIKMVSKNTISLDDLQKHLKKDNINVKWTGTKFTPKDLLLYRINTKSLKTSGNVLYKRVVTTNFQSAQKITHLDNSVSPVYYEDLKNQITGLQSRLDKIEKAMQQPKCPISWNFYATTGFCYKVFRDANRHGADIGCRQNGAHLASIHSLEEAMFVGTLAYVPGGEACDMLKQAWIGLSSNDNHTTWQWSDGSPFDYNKWGLSQPDNAGRQNCVQIFTSSNSCNWFLGDFDTIKCETKLSSYICKKAPE